MPPLLVKDSRKLLDTTSPRAHESSKGIAATSVLDEPVGLFALCC